MFPSNEEYQLYPVPQHRGKSIQNLFLSECHLFLFQILKLREARMDSSHVTYESVFLNLILVS